MTNSRQHPDLRQSPRHRATDGPLSPNRFSLRSFTLVEALLVMVLFGIGILSAMQASVIGMRMAESTYNELLAIKGVQEYYLEYFKSLDFNDSRLTPPKVNVAFPAEQNQSIALLSQDTNWKGFVPAGISGTYSVTDASPPSPPNPPSVLNTIKQVTVTVNWLDGSGRPRSSSATVQLNN